MSIEAEKVKVIGFDLDQTLYTKSPAIDEAIQAHLYKIIAETRGCTIEEASQLFNELYLEGRGLSGNKTMVALGIEDGGSAVQQALELANISDFLIPDQATISLLNVLSRKYLAVDLLTGSNRTHTLTKLGSLAIDVSLFGTVITSDEGSKSDGEAYRRWMSGYPELTADEFLYVGDRVQTDHIVPSNMGIQTVLVNIEKPDLTLDCEQLPTLVDLAKLLKIE